MGDVAQILGLAAPGASAAATATASELEKLKPASAAASMSAHKGAKQKKPSGMRREVLELLESTHRASHALLPGLNTLSLQQKWRQRRSIPAVKWCARRVFVRLSRLMCFEFSFACYGGWECRSTAGNASHSATRRVQDSQASQIPRVLRSATG